VRSRLGGGELVAALGLAAVGALVLVDTTTIAVPQGSNALGPRFFPYLVGGALLVVGLALAVAVARGSRGAAEEGEDVDTSRSADWRTLGVIAGTFVAYVLLVQPLGFLLATVGLFAGTAWALGARSWRPLLLTSVLVPFAAFMLFTRGLGIYLPNGVLAAVI
jgi:putative tricarboxylic transport membrane protein